MAVYNAMDLSAASEIEKASVLTQLKTIYGADTSYLTGNAVIQPGSLITPAGAAVSTTGSPAAQTGFTTTPVAISGAGVLT